MERAEARRDPGERDALGAASRLRLGRAAGPGERALQIQEPSREVFGLLDQRRAGAHAAGRTRGGQQRTRIRQGGDPLLGAPRGRRQIAHELPGGARGQPVDRGRAAHRALQPGRRRGHLERERGRELAALELALQRCREPVQKLEASAKPGARASERGGDAPGLVALIEEVSDQPRLLDRAHAPTDRVQGQALPRCRPVVEVREHRGHDPPAERQQGLVAQQPVDDLQAERRLADEQRLTQANGANAVLELVHPISITGGGGARPHERAQGHDTHPHASPMRARTAPTESASPPRGSRVRGVSGRSCHTPSTAPARQGR